MSVWRRYVSIFAIFCVFFHATAVVAHNSMALESALDSAARAASFGEICSGLAGGGDPSGKSSVPRCPICAGLPGSLLIPAAPAVDTPSAFLVQNRCLDAADLGFLGISLFWPPGRGPPLDA